MGYCIAFSNSQYILNHTMGMCKFMLADSYAARWPTMRILVCRSRHSQWDTINCSYYVSVMVHFFGLLSSNTHTPTYGTVLICPTFLSTFASKTLNGEFIMNITQIGLPACKYQGKCNHGRVIKMYTILKKTVSKVTPKTYWKLSPWKSLENGYSALFQHMSCRQRPSEFPMRCLYRKKNKSNTRLEQFSGVMVCGFLGLYGQAVITSLQNRMWYMDCRVKFV